MRHNIFTVLLLAAMAFTAMLGTARAGDPYIAKAQEWLNNLTTAKAQFVQVNPDRTQMKGTFYLNRPGRLRFEYDAPIDDFIVADGVLLHFYDSQIGEASNALIGQTMADFILRPDLDLVDPRESSIVVSQTNHSDTVFRMILVQKDDPDAGKIVLDFDKEPFLLRQWSIYDPQGSVTEIILTKLHLNLKLDGKLFRFVDPNAKSGHSFND